MLSTTNDIFDLLNNRMQKHGIPYKKYDIVFFF